MKNNCRTNFQKAIDFIFFPLRALFLFETDRLGLSSLRTERFDYVCREVVGRCLDVGCGKHNLFVTKFLAGNGIGIDVYPYEGLTEKNILEDITFFPFENESFETITFIANLNHIPESLRDRELSEAWRCLKPKGNVIITMGNPIAELLVHKLVSAYDKLFETSYDVDSIRGMASDESYFLFDSEIKSRLTTVGFKRLQKKIFWTQWGLNHLIMAWKV